MTWPIATVFMFGMACFVVVMIVLIRAEVEVRKITKGNANGNG